MAESKEILSKFNKIIEFPVKWGEMDAFGHLNNTTYFRYFEDVRIAYFESVSLLKIMDEIGIGPILASTSCKFIYPLNYPDTVLAAARVSQILEDRFIMEYLVYSKSKDRLAAKGEGVIVSFDYNENKKVAVPHRMRKNVEDFEGFSFSQES